MSMGLTSSSELLHFLKLQKDLLGLKEKQYMGRQYCEGQINSLNKSMSVPLQKKREFTRNPSLMDTIKEDIECPGYAYTGTGAFFMWLLYCFIFASVVMLLLIYRYEINKKWNDSTILCLWLLLPIVLLVLITFLFHVHRLRDHKKYLQLLAKENQKIDSRNAALMQDKERTKKIISLYQSQKSRLDIEIKKTDALIEIINRTGTIYPKYRNNLSYACAMYEYFASGQCETLVGPFGAYTRLEHDIQYGAIIDRLDSINKKLDVIIQNQRELYDILSECNDAIRKLDTSMKSMSNRIDSYSSGVNRYLDRIEYNTKNSSDYAAFCAQCEFYRTYWN